MSRLFSEMQTLIRVQINPEKHLRKLLRSANENQAHHLRGEIFAELYWAKRNPHWFKERSRLYFATIRRVHRWLSRYLDHNLLLPETNQNGLIVRRGNYLGGIDRYESAMASGHDAGWECYYSDAYSCFWGNKEKLKFRSYCEGDITTLQAATLAQWELELECTLQWYKENA